MIAPSLPTGILCGEVARHAGDLDEPEAAGLELLIKFNAEILFTSLRWVEKHSSWLVLMMDCPVHLVYPQKVVFDRSFS